jgi:hypothetical protein
VQQGDTTRLEEGAALAVASNQHDVQRWHCHTKLEKLRVDSHRARLALLTDLKDLHAIDQHAQKYGLAAVLGGKNIGELQREAMLEAGFEPELLEVKGNLLVYGGASCQWQTLIGNGTTTAGQSLTYFSNAQAAIGVGDSTTAAAATQTDLQAATNKLRVAMDATYPQHTDGTTSGSASIVYRSTFSTAQANYAWQEWGIFNSATAGTGRMLNRKVESLGTKTSASTWTLTLTLTLA